MANFCKECGATVTKGELCLYCKSKKSHCKKGNFYQKKLSIYVPWCKEKDKPVLISGGKWLCDECENRRTKDEI
ncbi:MAG: hypothetical protein ACOCRO_11190 [Halanaerobiales bacterium]